MSDQNSTTQTGIDPFAFVSPTDPGHVHDYGGTISAGEHIVEPEPVTIEPAIADNPSSTSTPAVDANPTPDVQPEPSAEPTVEPVQGSSQSVTTEAEKLQKNYDNLRAVFNKRDTEIVTLRDENKILQERIESLATYETQLPEIQKERDEYKTWYEQYAPLFAEVAKDPVVAQKLQDIYNAKQAPLTREDALAIAREEFKRNEESKQSDRMIDEFVSRNKDLFSDPVISEKFKNAIGKYDRVPDQETMEVLLNGIAADKIAERKAQELLKKQDARLQLVDNARVGGSTTAIPSGNAENDPMSGLFQRPPGTEFRL